MATAEQKEQLAETLKFTPVTYKLSLWGYGGEIAMGSLTEAQYEFWKDKDESDIIGHCTGYDDDNEFEEEYGYKIPEEAKFCSDGAWYETEGQLDHMWGCEFNESCHIQVDDENGDEVFNQGLTWELEENHGVQLEQDEIYAGNTEGVDGYFCFQSSEKGTFFEADIELKQPFDPSKLKIYTTDFEGWELVSHVEYDGEELDNQGGDTTGKGYYASINLT